MPESRPRHAAGVDYRNRVYNKVSMQTKAPNPASALPDEGLSPFLRAYFEFNHLKQLYRQGWLKRGIPEERCESVAEHSFGVALLTLFLCDRFYAHLDCTKAVRMALLHDFGEIFAGDLTPSDSVDPHQKHLLEAEAVHKIFSGLPDGGQYIELWEEFEAGESPEAQLIRQLDKLEMGLQAGVYAQQGWGDLSEFYNSAAASLSDPILVETLQELGHLQRRGEDEDADKPMPKAAQK